MKERSGKDPRKLKQWKQMNQTDYAKKLTDTERQWLHAFNAEYFKGRPREDALDQCPEEISCRTVIDETLSYQPKQSYLGVTLDDLKFYLRIKKDGESERGLSRETGIPRTTIQYRLQLVEMILSSISWPNLFGNLDGEEKNDQII